VLRYNPVSYKGNGKLMSYDTGQLLTHEVPETTEIDGHAAEFLKNLTEGASGS
jgi:hypothetical protein